MVAALQILASFLTDSLRLCSQASECVRELTEQAAKKRVSPAQVRSLYQIVHTLKGSASMVTGAESVVKALETLEAKLACQPVTKSAQNPDWLPLAQQSLHHAYAALQSLKNREKNSPASSLGAPPKGAAARGILARARWKGTESLYWFPLSIVVQVLSPGELAGREALNLRGAWVPVVGGPAPSAEKGEACFGLALRFAAGQLVLAVREIAGVTGWAEAVRLGAQNGELLHEAGPKPASAKIAA